MPPNGSLWYGLPPPNPIQPLKAPRRRRVESTANASPADLVARLTLADATFWRRRIRRRLLPGAESKAPGDVPRAFVVIEADGQTTEQVTPRFLRVE